jgi:hypothetical protein
MVAMLLLALPVSGQDVQSGETSRLMTIEIGVPSDWTHRHVIFSESSPDAKTSLVVQEEPRYWLQAWKHRKLQAAVSEDRADPADIRESHAEEILHDEISTEDATWDFRARRRNPLKRDWNQTFQINGVTYSFTSPTYPAKYSFSSANPTANCNSDYIVYTLPTGGSTFPGNFNIIAYNNLYVSTAGGSSFCTGTAPQALFGYNASTAGGTLNGSPALSLDGSLIAFVENATAASGGAVFHILKWKSGNTQKVDTAFPAAFNGSALANCATTGAVAPCEYSVQFSSPANTATLSSPFVDYTHDIAYVSDDGGNVYAISPVFTATPTNPPTVQTGWPVNVGSSVVLTPPVYDSGSMNVFVASTGSAEFFIKTSTSATGTCVSGSPPCLGSNTFAFTGGGTIAESPVVDSSTGRVFLFGTQSGGTSGSYMIQTDITLSPGSVVSAKIGAGTLNQIHSGTPDNNYFTSVGTGKFYACGQNGSGEGQLYAYGFNVSGVMNATPVSGSPFALGQSISSNSPCSDGITEVYNQSGSTDWLFLAVANRCVNVSFGGNGCILSFNITSAFPSAVSHQIATPGTTGATGISVDNVTDASATMTTTDIYYIQTTAASCTDYLGSNHTGQCAISATQSGLQ